MASWLATFFFQYLSIWITSHGQTVLIEYPSVTFLSICHETSLITFSQWILTPWHDKSFSKIVKPTTSGAASEDNFVVTVCTRDRRYDNLWILSTLKVSVNGHIGTTRSSCWLFYHYCRPGRLSLWSPSKPEQQGPPADYFITTVGLVDCHSDHPQSQNNKVLLLITFSLL